MSQFYQPPSSRLNLKKKDKKRKYPTILLTQSLILLCMVALAVMIYSLTNIDFYIQLYSFKEKVFRFTFVAIFALYLIVTLGPVDLSSSVAA